MSKQQLFEHCLTIACIASLIIPAIYISIMFWWDEHKKKQKLAKTASEPATPPTT
ncbi:MAG: hypothetical protein WCT37_00375 [Patescibacteria group bacterium]|jgi:hypothetical protein